MTRCLARNSHFTPLDGSELEGAAELDAIIPRDRVPKDLTYICMTQYDKHFTLPVVSPPESLGNILANVMAELNMRNLRVAETEKYAHVTYFFNGGNEKPFPGEERVMVPVSQGRDLRPKARDERRRDRRRRGQGDRRQDLRRDGRELRQRRHGRPLRQNCADGQGRRGRRRLPGPDLRRAASAAAEP